MAAPAKQQDNLKVLREEASKVIDDLSHLGKVLAEVGEDRSTEAKEKTEAYLSREFERLHERLNTLGERIAESTRAADRHIRANPYLYIMGSMGLGFLMGKILSTRGHA